VCDNTWFVLSVILWNIIQCLTKIQYMQYFYICLYSYRQAILQIYWQYLLCPFFIYCFIFILIKLVWARGSVVGWGTMLQVGRSPVRVPSEVDFFNLPNPSSRTMALVSTQPLTEMCTRNFPGGKKRPERRTDNFATNYETNVWKCGSLNLSQP
jgi:hypothetical protein